MKAIISPLAGLVVSVLIIVFCGKEPVAALSSLFTGTFTSPYYFGAMLNTAAFLMTAGSGASLAMKSGNMNLGGEGQVYAGGFVSALILGSAWAHESAFPLLVFAVALLATLATGALLALISAFLKETRGAAVLLTSFLVSAASLPLIDGCLLAIKNRYAASQQLIALPYIASRFKFPQLLSPSPLTGSFFAACLICVFLWLFLQKTTAGRHVRIWGAAPQFAEAAGYASKKNTYGALAVSGALHALTGLFAVCGTFYTCHKDFYMNMGWNALSCALIVSSHPLALIPSALVLSWLYTSAGRVALTQGFSFDIAGIVQGVVLFAIAIPFAVNKHRSK